MDSKNKARTAPAAVPPAVATVAAAALEAETLEAAAAHYVPGSIAAAAARYLAAVDVFCREGRPPTWRAETLERKGQ